MGRAVRTFIAFAIVATASIAHAPVPARLLRLQLEAGKLQGLLVYHLPAAAAGVYASAPDLSVALAPAALHGLRIEADGAPLQPKVAEAAVRKAPDGALDASFLISVGPLRRSLRVGVEAGLPLPVALIAQSGVKLSLKEGPGAPMRGGLSLHPRPGVQCAVEISK